MIRLFASPDAHSKLRHLATQLAANGVELVSASEATADCRVLTSEEAPANRESLTELPTLIVTAEPSIRNAVRWIKAGADDYLPLPLEIEELLAAIERALAENRRPETRSEAPITSIEIPGYCSAIEELRARVRQVGGTDSPALVIGEIGSGKELVARALHRLSPRRHSPLLTLNCSALPPPLVEAELFGIASTQPGNVQRGLIRAAQGGTLLLEDVGELADTAQARLLEVLTSGSLRPPGATERVRVDVRILATANQSLAPLVAAGRFSAALESSIATISLLVPPLRERGDDTLLLARDMLEAIQQRLGRSGLEFAQEAERSLRAYHWPGNVRELENAIERAALLCSGGMISTEDLGIRLEAPAHRAGSAAVPSSDTAMDSSSLEEYFVNFVLEHQDSLTETELAERLGISRKSLWERRQRLNIPRTRTRKRGRRRDNA